jgi:hypothetical protein
LAYSSIDRDVDSSTRSVAPSIDEELELGMRSNGQNAPGPGTNGGDDNMTNLDSDTNIGDGQDFDGPPGFNQGFTGHEQPSRSVHTSSAEMIKRYLRKTRHCLKANMDTAVNIFCTNDANHGFANWKNLHIFISTLATAPNPPPRA